jgi:signal transduction histidine kinase
VTHDIKNGLTPIRHVFRHLEDELDSRPSELATVFGARRAGLDASISYLEGLAASYGRIARQGARQRTDLNGIVRRAADNGRVTPNARVTVDPLSLQRIVENLLDNAIDCLEGRGGDVTLTTRVVDEDGSARVRLSVRDTGPGMGEDQRSRIFEDFYTTKPNGTGLGLSIVRRLVMDLDGAIRVESLEGSGSCFIVDMPPAGTPGRGGGE